MALESRIQILVSAIQDSGGQQLVSDDIWGGQAFSARVQSGKIIFAERTSSACLEVAMIQ